MTTDPVPADENPVMDVKSVPIEKVQANDYNPNSVAERELELLYTSIREDGFTQPVVTVHDEEQDIYVIVDGFHRYMIMKKYEDIYEANEGLLPVVVIEKDITDRMASTIRHNRARGKHSIAGMSSLVFRMLKEGESEAAICEELGLTPDELTRLKYITGFEKYFREIEYRDAWKTKKQIETEKEALEDASSE